VSASRASARRAARDAARVRSALEALSRSTGALLEVGAGGAGGAEERAALAALAAPPRLRGRSGRFPAEAGADSLR